MDAAGKGQVSIGGAPYIEFIGRGELFGIAICGANTKRDLGSCRHIDTAELHGLRGDAVAELVRTFVAQELLDGVGRERGVFA